MKPKAGLISLTVVRNENDRSEHWDRIFDQDSFRCEFVSFSTAAKSTFRWTEPTVAVIIAVPLSDLLAEIVGQIQSKGCSLSTLAIIPRLPEDNSPMPAQLARVLPVVDDFAVWPTDAEELRWRLKRLAGTRCPEVEDEIQRQFSMGRLIGRDPAFLQSISLIPHFARSAAPVLISGETGTGKELCARALHQISERRNGPFIAVDCGALPERLFENELFGHVRGAFTDAHQSQKGLALLADKGTLFLDEIHSLTLLLQNKLLRFIQEKTVRPLGSEKVFKSDVKIVTGTNCRLEQMAANGEFRMDLLFRIDVLRITLPALRDRPMDLELLAKHILSVLNCRYSDEHRHKILSVGALSVLRRYKWPGNIRELQNVLERAMALCEGLQILSHHIRLRNEDAQHIEFSSPLPPETMKIARARCLADFESDYVARLIRKNGGNVSAAAREAGKERRAFGRLIQKYHIQKAAEPTIQSA